ncbi:hypothetical protein HY503_01645 [Candidatus Woesebacteria bacterium]|nr:hypothetical protein [Candidatus Woesebacteria bacterium]
MKRIVKQVARQIVQEPLEILKQGGKQIARTETLRTQKPQGAPNQSSEETNKQLEQKIKEKDTRLIAALEKEIEDIRTQKKIEEQKAKEQPQPPEVKKPLVEPSTKRSRRLFSFGPKAQAERQKTRVEKPLPPTG